MTDLTEAFERTQREDGEKWITEMQNLVKQKPPKIEDGRMVWDQPFDCGTGV